MSLGPAHLRSPISPSPDTTTVQSDANQLSAGPGGSQRKVPDCSPSLAGTGVEGSRLGAGQGDGTEPGPCGCHSGHRRRRH